jgi:lipopolysaccharide/colanic/teichoic acid biosynthesis glycosyltransferase
VDSAAIPAWKRPFDLALIFLILPGVILVVAVLAALIKTVAPGPVFIQEERVGFRRKRFMCYKFRTMRLGMEGVMQAPASNGAAPSPAPMNKPTATGAPQSIPCGRWLRATGMDELAQLINVVRGEMSLVGPRPGLPDEEEGLRPWQQARFDTLPGLTGLWQVCGKCETTWAEMVTLDIHYAHNASFLLDLSILARTVVAVVLEPGVTRTWQSGSVIPPRGSDRQARAGFNESELASTGGRLAHNRAT